MPPASDVLKRYRSGQGWTAGNPGEIDSTGLQMPPEVAMIIQSMLMPGVPRGVGQAMAQAPQRLAGEAGALFPEGEIPNITSWAMKKEAEDVIPQSEQNWMRNMKNYDWHAENNDWPRVLRDKWAMLKGAQGN